MISTAHKVIAPTILIIESMATHLTNGQHDLTYSAMKVVHTLYRW